MLIVTVLLKVVVLVILVILVLRSLSVFCNSVGKGSCRGNNFDLGLYTGAALWVPVGFEL